MFSPLLQPVVPGIGAPPRLGGLSSNSWQAPRLNPMHSSGNTLMAVPSGPLEITQAPVGVSLRFLMNFAQGMAPDALTSDVVRDYIIPATQISGGSFTQLLPNADIGPSTFYVCHSWHVPFQHLVQMLQEYAAAERRLSPSETYFWIDVFTVSQAQTTVDMQQQIYRIHDVISKVRMVLLCVDVECSALSRLWCLYEILAAGASNLSKITALTHKSFKQHGQTQVSINVAVARCTSDSATEALMARIQDAGGVEWANAFITKALIQSLTSCVLQRALGHGLMSSERNTSEFFCRFVHLLAACGQHGEARLLQKRLLKVHKAGGDKAALCGLFSQGTSRPNSELCARVQDGVFSAQACASIVCENSAHAADLEDTFGGTTSASAQTSSSSHNPDEERNEEPSTFSDPTTKKRKAQSASARPSKPALRFEDLQSKFHLGLKEAAVELGVCITTLKRICRRLGVSRWPKRQVRRVQQALLDMGCKGPPPAPLVRLVATHECPDTIAAAMLALSQSVPAHLTPEPEGPPTPNPPLVASHSGPAPMLATWPFFPDACGPTSGICGDNSTKRLCTASLQHNPANPVAEVLQYAPAQELSTLATGISRLPSPQFSNHHSQNTHLGSKQVQPDAGTSPCAPLAAFPTLPFDAPGKILASGPSVVVCKGQQAVCGTFKPDFYHYRIAQQATDPASNSFDFLLMAELDKELCSSPILSEFCLPDSVFLEKGMGVAQAPQDPLYEWDKSAFQALGPCTTTPACNTDVMASMEQHAAPMLLNSHFESSQRFQSMAQQTLRDSQADSASNCFKELACWSNLMGMYVGPPAFDTAMQNAGLSMKLEELPDCMGQGNGNVTGATDAAALMFRNNNPKNCVPMSLLESMMLDGDLW